MTTNRNAEEHIELESGAEKRLRREDGPDDHVRVHYPMSMSRLSDSAASVNVARSRTSKRVCVIVFSVSLAPTFRRQRMSLIAPSAASSHWRSTLLRPCQQRDVCRLRAPYSPVPGPYTFQARAGLASLAQHMVEITLSGCTMASERRASAYGIPARHGVCSEKRHV